MIQKIVSSTIVTILIFPAGLSRFFSFALFIFLLYASFSDILTKDFCKEKKSKASDEAERVVLAVRELLKNVIKNHDHVVNGYLNMDENFTATNENVPNLLSVFAAELIKLPLKQNSISEAIFAATRPKTLILI